MKKEFKKINVDGVDVVQIFFWGFHIEKIKMDIYVHRFELKAKKAKRSRLARSNCEFVFN